jgi:hypothetical protein
MSDAFVSQGVLRQLRALGGVADPKVVTLQSRVTDWASLREADVVVAVPNSISPRYYSPAEVPRDLFDLVIIDEAHHSPAPTWRALLDHFSPQHALLLTATPRRTDGQQLPGVHIFHYPLRQALDDKIYQPVTPVILELQRQRKRGDVDELIARRVVDLAARPEHATSTVLIRSNSITRAKTLAKLYKRLGLDAPVLHSKMKEVDRDAVISDLRNGSCRAVAVVEMLGEGFDLPSLRIGAYHDKHKSVLPTVQLIGRLVRVDSRYPQPSMLVAARDIDTYPQLKGAARALYEEDSDWAEALPGLIDDEVAEKKADRAYAHGFAPPPPELSLESLTPLCRAVVYDVVSHGWQPELAKGVVPEGARQQQRIAGQTVLYASVSPSNTTLAVVTSAVLRPKWHDEHPGLDSQAYELHLVTWLAARQTGHRDLLLVNTPDSAMARALIAIVGRGAIVAIGDPRAMQDAFDGVRRRSVSSVGVRNTYNSGPGIPRYSMYAGSGVDRGLRDVDTAQRALGHAIAQVDTGEHGYSAGIATGKSKYWETRYVSLRRYEVFATELAERYWFPPTPGTLRLLPTLSRGRRIGQFPGSKVAVVELNPALLGKGWTLGKLAIDDVDLQWLATDPAKLSIQAIDPLTGRQLWRGSQDTQGLFNNESKGVAVTRGYGVPADFAELLSDYPPTVFFLDGQTVHGHTIYESQEPRNALPAIHTPTLSWNGVNIRAESRAAAGRSPANGISIHEHLEAFLKATPKRRHHRWIVLNDGAGEIADYLVIEMDDWQHVDLWLWHAKGASGPGPGVRVGDMQVVVAQAIKSRRYVTDRNLWTTLGDRLDGTAGPKAVCIEGSTRLLNVLCGKSKHETWSITQRPPSVSGHIGIVQPGLSWGTLAADLGNDVPSLAARQIRELLTVWHDASAQVADVTLLVSS